MPALRFEKVMCRLILSSMYSISIFRRPWPPGRGFFAAGSDGPSSAASASASSSSSSACAIASGSIAAAESSTKECSIGEEGPLGAPFDRECGALWLPGSKDPRASRRGLGIQSHSSRPRGFSPPRAHDRTSTSAPSCRRSRRPSTSRNSSVKHGWSQALLRRVYGTYSSRFPRLCVYSV